MRHCLGKTDPGIALKPPNKSRLASKAHWVFFFCSGEAAAKMWMDLNWCMYVNLNGSKHIHEWCEKWRPGMWANGDSLLHLRNEVQTCLWLLMKWGNIHMVNFWHIFYYVKFWKLKAFLLFNECQGILSAKQICQFWLFGKKIFLFKYTVNYILNVYEHLTMTLICA